MKHYHPPYVRSRRNSILFFDLLTFTFFLLGSILSPIALPGQSFRQTQMRNSRVRSASLEKNESIKREFQSRSLRFPPDKIFLRVFKEEKSVELWVKKTTSDSFALLKQFSICASSGGLGPKRRQGDGQIPEGIYHIELFNPTSQFYLSLRLNYPNQSDRIFSDHAHPGGDIYIHGSCVTIGCIPIEDAGIKELYLIAMEARSRGQAQIPVHIFPCKLDEDRWTTLQTEYADHPGVISFWKNLKSCYEFFQRHQTLPTIRVRRDGLYEIVD